MKKIAKPIIELSNICRKDKKGTIDRLSLSLTGGDCFAVVYRNDDNIELLFEIFRGRVAPTKGKIFFKGDDVTGIRNVFGVVSKKPVMPKLKNVAQFAAAPVIRRGLSRSMSDVLVRKEIKAFGIEELADESCTKLSEEDAMKAAIFSAYMCSHELVVLNEPQESLSDAANWLSGLKASSTLSLLIFTKDADFAVEIADYVMVTDKNTSSSGIIAVDKNKKARAREQLAELLKGR